MRSSNAGTIICLVLVGASAGCRFWTPPPSADSPLKPAVASSDSITLEIFFARLPQDSPDADASSAALWETVDEQRIPSALRRRLAENGFRAGVVAGQIPPSLADLLHLTDQRPTAEESARGVNVQSEPAVRRRLLQLRSGKRGEILASGIYPQLPLLLSDQGQVRGQTFADAQCLFAAEVQATPGGAELTLLPEVHYGQPRQHWNGREGILRLDMGRAKETFPRLNLPAVLAPGEMLLVAPQPGRAGSLGHHFLRDESQPQQPLKLLVVRLADAPQGDRFSSQ